MIRVRRGAVSAFIAAHPFAWEAAMAGLTSIYVALAFLEDSTPATFNWLTVILGALCCLFVAEFLIRFADSEDRMAYARRHWLDLITAVPFIGPLRAVRILRLLRFFRLSMHMRAAISSRHGNRRIADDNSWLLWPSLLLFWMCAAYGLWIFEGDANPNIHSYGTAMLAALLTAATLGYGGITPATLGGQIVSGTIVFVSIGLVGFASSRLTTLWLGQKDDQMPEQIAQVQRELVEVRRGIDHIERLLQRSKSQSVVGIDPKDLIPIAGKMSPPRND